MFGRLGGWEILIIVLLVVILFGHSKIPGMMKNLADGINTFKKEIKNKSEKSTKKPAKAGAKLSDACWLLYLQPEDGCL